MLRCSNQEPRRSGRATFSPSSADASRCRDTGAPAQNQANPKFETPKPKQTLSAAGRRAIIAATQKRWAAVVAAKAAIA